MHFRYLLISFLLIFLTACFSKKEPQQIIPAFYHWQTAVHLSDFEKEYLQQLGIEKLYLKFFDVDVEDGQIIPKALIYGDSLAGILKNKTI